MSGSDQNYSSSPTVDGERPPGTTVTCSSTASQSVTPRPPASRTASITTTMGPSTTSPLLSQASQAQRSVSEPSAYPSRPVPPRRNSGYRWGLDWLEVFSSDDEREKWDSESETSTEQSEPEYFDLGRRRFVADQDEEREDGMDDGQADAGAGAGAERMEGSDGVEDEDWLSDEDERGEGQAQAGAEREQVAGVDDLARGRAVHRQSERTTGNARAEQRGSSVPSRSGTPHPRGEWYEGDREGTIWNAGLNGFG